MAKLKKIKGRRSYVLDDLAAGGMITTRLPKTLHVFFALKCQKEGVSMNQCVINLMLGYVREKEYDPLEPLAVVEDKTPK